MQSVLQFRSFRRNVQAQVSRHDSLQKANSRSPNRSSTAASFSDHTTTEERHVGFLAEPVRQQRSHQQSGHALHHTLTGIATRTLTGTNDQVFVVGYEGDDDDLNPHNWSYLRRWLVTIMVASLGFIVGIASSIDSIGADLAATDLHVSDVAESLATGIYLVGFGVGALVAGPFSETFGRNPVYITTLAIFILFEVGAALAPNFAAQILFRFFAGFFGATPLVVSGGSLADVWTPVERTLTFPLFAQFAFLGPVLGPVLSGFISQSYLGWRWCDWITVIWAGAIWIVLVLFLPETYAPMLLKWKAQHMRSITGDNRYKAPLEIRETTFFQRMGTALWRPFVICFRELIVLLIALYLTVIYIVLFGFLTAYPFIFGDVHGFGLGLQGLSFVGIAIGLTLCVFAVPVVYMRYKKGVARSKNGKLPPEQRLVLAMCLGWTLPVSLYWMAWTDYSDISVWSPLGASVLTGIGILSVFISCYQYIIDSYEIYAASALAAITFIRYMASGGAVVFAFPMYSNIGVHWALTTFATVSLIMVPIPFVFYRYGKFIRSKSKFAVVDELDAEPSKPEHEVD